MITEKDCPELYAANIRRFRRRVAEIVERTRQNLSLPDFEPQPIIRQSKPAHKHDECHLRLVSDDKDKGVL